MVLLKILGRACVVICILFALATIMFTPSDDLPNWFVWVNALAILLWILYMFLTWRCNRKKANGRG